MDASAHHEGGGSERREAGRSERREAGGSERREADGSEQRKGGGSERRSGSGRDESEHERLDRNLGELLQELRVAIPGVQVLFAFLLVVPFNQRFADITSFQRTVYFVTLLLATAATVCLIAPTAHHRIEFRAQDKRRIVFGATRLAIIGLTLLAFAMTGAVTLITDFIYGTTTVTITAILVVLLFAFLWYVIPIRRLLDDE
jgi:hypothetical protein